MQFSGRQGLAITPYERHQPEQTLLYKLVETHYPALVDQLAQQGKARFFVFDRASQPCRICKTKVQRATANSRGIYTCTSCQDL